jgi:hypothetical protein
MGVNTYPTSVAIQLVAIGRLQHQADSAKNLFLEDRRIRAADSILRKMASACSNQDRLPRSISVQQIASAITEADPPADSPIAALQTAADALLRKAISNIRRTVWRRHAKQRPLPIHGLASPDRTREIDKRMDIVTLANRASPTHREVLLRRAAGQDDKHIAAAMHLQPKHIPVLVHRAVRHLRLLAPKTFVEQ